MSCVKWPCSARDLMKQSATTLCLPFISWLIPRVSHSTLSSVFAGHHRKKNDSPRKQWCLGCRWGPREAPDLFAFWSEGWRCEGKYLLTVHDNQLLGLWDRSPSSIEQQGGRQLGLDHSTGNRRVRRTVYFRHKHLDTDRQEMALPACKCLTTLSPSSLQTARLLLCFLL